MGGLALNLHVYIQRQPSMASTTVSEMESVHSSTDKISESTRACTAPPPNILANSMEQPTSAASPDDSVPRPLITRADVNQALGVL